MAISLVFNDICIDQKSCNRCYSIKSIDFFNKDRSKFDGKSGICKECKKTKFIDKTAKRCSKCKIVKPLDSFSNNKLGKFGKYSQCSYCKYHNLSETSKEKRTINKRNYQKLNSKTLSKKKSIKDKLRRKADVLFYLKYLSRARLNNALKHKSWKKNTHFSEYIGCSLSELKAHLESKFEPGMSWNNKHLWHIDHDKPLSLAKTPEELYNLCHYTNLQPLWAIDNLRKGNKYPILTTNDGEM